jgi:serine/threonine protein kinase
METCTRDGFWSVWRRNVSTHTHTHHPNHFCSPPRISILIQHPIISSAADEISGETVAIKMVTRIFAKATLAKRALRELALLRHFNNHENITGLIDVDGIAETFNEM